MNMNLEDWMEKWRESQLGTACMWISYTIFLAMLIYGVVLPFFGIMIGLYAIGLMFCWPCCCTYYIIKNPDVTKEIAVPFLQKES